jgi:hypothetical protein
MISLIRIQLLSEGFLLKQQRDCSEIQFSYYKKKLARIALTLVSHHQNSHFSGTVSKVAIE